MSTETKQVFPAIAIVHWPGKDTAACNDHRLKLLALANVLGFQLSCTPIVDATPCANCENEATK